MPGELNNQPTSTVAHTHQCHGTIWLGPSLTVACYIWALDGQLTPCAICSNVFCTMHINFNSSRDKWICRVCSILSEMH